MNKKVKQEASLPRWCKTMPGTAPVKNAWILNNCFDSLEVIR